ncbi:MAG TPA: nuclear transport factor 2 family protein [Bryobacteraceae bacterium]|jgi:uncharacterized protein (TIGR02246 family)|nr:nuclear transport factor 2 family protein [Bryobacteraceae bacterium]
MGKLLAVLVVTAFVAYPQASMESRIREVLAVQVAAWNRGDIPTFVKTYAPKCTFVGSEVIHGRDAVLARYRKRYPTPAAMGHLTFGSIAAQQLSPTTAIAYGTWHLERSSNGGGPVGGIFSLVFESINGSWLIVLDHTS